MLDVDFDFQGLRTDRTFLRWYTRFEHSPEIDYYGLGNRSTNLNRTSYKYDDLASDFNASFEVTRGVRIGATGGYFHAHTGRSGEDGVPPIDEAYPPETLPGLGEDTDYTRIGVFTYYDTRDSLTGPRSGGLLVARYREVLGRRTEGVRLQADRVRGPEVRAVLQQGPRPGGSRVRGVVLPQEGQFGADVSSADARWQ